MFELSSPSLPSDKARTLLRRLRDLNLTAGPVAVTRELGVVIAGCLSLDGPAESGVRYRVRLTDGTERLLEIGIRDAKLLMSTIGSQPGALRHLEATLTYDRNGRACARTIRARVQPDSNDTRELEHFLRRVVRAVLR